MPRPRVGKGGVNNISSGPGRVAYQAVGDMRRSEAQRDDQVSLDEMCRRRQELCNLRFGYIFAPVLGLMTSRESNP